MRTICVSQPMCLLLFLTLLSIDPRNKLARACDILFGGTGGISWEQVNVHGPEHARVYEYVVKSTSRIITQARTNVCIKVDNKEYGRGQGSSISNAKNEAARVALAALRVQHPNPKI